jgi:ribonuclease HII
VENTIIDTIGIKKANKLAMQTALEEVMRKLALRKEELTIQIDGNDKYQLHSEISATSIIK